jgi:hypothetical protein
MYTGVAAGLCTIELPEKSLSSATRAAFDLGQLGDLHEIVDSSTLVTTPSNSKPSISNLQS